MLQATLLLLLLGLGAAIVLAIASRVFYVWEDPRVLAVADSLPGANCGGCGFAGCQSAAEAIAAGQAPPDVCVAGGFDTAQAVAATMGMSVKEKEPEVAWTSCRYGIGGRPGYEKEWRAKAEISGGGQLVDQGVHVLDLCRWFLGDFEEVAGIVATHFWDIAPLEDNAFALLRTGGGQIASLHVSWTQWKPLFSFEVFGRDGYIQVEGLGGAYGTERATLGRRDFQAPFAEETVENRREDASWREEWLEFLAAIAERREPLGSGEDGVAALRLARRVVAYTTAEIP